MSEWIPCKKRLPDELVLVLTYQKEEHMKVDYIIKFTDSNEFIWANEMVDDWVKITHWMPLPSRPEPPKSDNT